MNMNFFMQALVAFLILFTSSTIADEFDGWNQGRATFYGDDGGASIHQGSCMMDIGSLSTGNDIAALSDSNPDYRGSCGRCYEVACRPTHITDGYGNDMDRTGTCQGQKSVIITITDTCPCYYPSNQYSNTRWCCGDQYHMDLSKWAFEKIGNTGHGVMGIYYRAVPCPGGGSAVIGCSHNDACHGGSSSSSSSSSSDGSSSSSSSSWSSDGSSSSSSSSSDGSSSSSSSWSSSSGSSWFSSSSSSSDKVQAGKRKLLKLLGQHNSQPTAAAGP